MTYKAILKHKDNEFNDTETEVEIKFISQRMIDTFSEVFGEITELTTLHGLVTDHKKNRRLAKKEGKETLETFDAEMKKVIEKYKYLCSERLKDKRLNLIIDILKKNKCKNEKLLDPDFWAEYVDPAEANSFAASCIMRDKKKAI